MIAFRYFVGITGCSDYTCIIYRLVLNYVSMYFGIHARYNQYDSPVITHPNTLTSISEVGTMTLHNKNNSIINNYNNQTLPTTTTFIAYLTTNNLADYLDLPCVIFVSADLKKITFFRFNYQKVFGLIFLLLYRAAATQFVYM